MSDQGSYPFRHFATLAGATLLLAGCLEEESAFVQSPDGGAQPPPPPANSAPVISGSPPGEIEAGSAYTFTPGATDADNDPLTFTVDNLPGWASFDATNGRIGGTPGSADVMTYSNIMITVSDGTATDSLGPFSITVQPIGSGTGSVTLTWTPPTHNADGTQLTDLVGYRFYWGTTPGSYTDSVTVENPGISSYVVEGLFPGTYEFVATVYNSAGIESTFSNAATTTVQ